MKSIKNVGLIIFIFSFVLFLGVFFMGKYNLTHTVFSTWVKPKHQELLQPKLSEVFEKTFNNSVVFSNTINEAIQDINSKIRAEQRWNEIIYDDYGTILTMHSVNGWIVEKTELLFILVFVVGAIGAMMYLLPKIKLNGQPGIKNNNILFDPLNNRGWLGILLGTLLILFYIFLYFYPAYVVNWTWLVDPLQKIFNPNATASQWFLYGFLYTFAVVVMGIRMIIKYRHSKYQMIRTCSLMFFQTSFAFILPEILVRLNQPYFDFKNMWPLDYDFFDAWHLNTLTSAGGVGIFMLVWGITLFVIGVPVLVYFFGKRWYCSWVCGCGGLAETAGDPFRQLSSKKLSAWKIERYLVHAVLLFSIIMTTALIYNFISGTNTFFGLDSYTFLRKPYGFLIGSIFSGVIGTGFYPLMGNRVWCRFGCPLAAYLGLVQRFKSRFRITTNGGQCISCGNCSTYCEMGIDVRWYAQRGQNIVRSSCVGCGVCSSVCPRGVLNLENKDEKGRINVPTLIGNNLK